MIILFSNEINTHKSYFQYLRLIQKIIYFRNRLENNSDHWNALFLSLRELAEWTVKKESELESMSPIGGDEATIRKQQVRIQKIYSY